MFGGMSHFANGKECVGLTEFPLATQESVASTSTISYGAWKKKYRTTYQPPALYIGLMLAEGSQRRCATETSESRRRMNIAITESRIMEVCMISAYSQERDCNLRLRKGPYPWSYKQVLGKL